MGRLPAKKHEPENTRTYGYILSGQQTAQLPLVPVNADRLIKEVGRRLGELRESRGLTQQGLADALGKSMRYIQAVEAGGENLTLRTIVVFANALKVPPSTFLETPATRRRPPGRPKKRA